MNISTRNFFQSLLIFLFLISILSSISNGQSSSIIHWENIPGPYGSRIDDLIADSAIGIFATLRNKLFHSTDDGRTWSRHSEFDTTIVKVTVAPDRNLYLLDRGKSIYRFNNSENEWDTLYAQEHPGPLRRNITVTAKGSIIISTVYDVLRSTDSGKTWVKTRDKGGSFFLQFEDRLFLMSNKKLFVSDNDGQTWSRVGSDFEFNDDVLCVANDSILIGLRRYIRGEDILISYDSGNTWDAIPYRLSQPDKIHNLLCDQPGFIYALSNKGIYKVPIPNAESDTLRWEQVSVFTTPLTYLTGGGLYNVLRTFKRTFLVNTGNSLLRSVDNGVNWERSEKGLHFPKMNSLTTIGDSSIIATANGGGVYSSNDLGATWHRFTETYLDDQQRSTLSAAVAYDSDKNSLGNLYVATEAGIYKSTDTGRSWALSSPKDYKTDYLAIGNTGSVIAGYRIGDPVYLRSLNNGKTWDSLEKKGIYHVTYDPYAKVFYAGIYYKANDKRNGYYRSDDGGQSWTTQITSHYGLRGLYINQYSGQISKECRPIQIDHIRYYLYQMTWVRTGKR